MKKSIKRLITVFAVCAVSAFAVVASGCNVTDKIKEKIEQARCEHEWNDGEVTKEATCLEVGELTKTCTLCNKSETEEIALKEHTPYMLSAVAPTCTENGLGEGSKCVVCDTILVAQEVIYSLGHTLEVDEAVPATCLMSGLTAGSHCTTCDEIVKAQEVIPAKGHNVVTETGYSATCTTTGKTDYIYCSNCDEVYKSSSEIPAFGHSYGDGVITKEANCKNSGVKTYTCETCNDKKVEEIAATGVHTIINVNGYSATCTSTGLTSGQKCSVCNDVIVAQEEIPLLLHTYDNGTIIKNATCGIDGVLRYTCTMCNKTKDDVIPATGSHFVETVAGKAATCTSTGLTNGQKCSVCDTVIAEQEVIEKLAHTYNDGVISIDPTCTSMGVKTFTCLTCGSTTSEKVDTIAHADITVFDGFCDMCGVYFDYIFDDETAYTTVGVEIGETVANKWYRIPMYQLSGGEGIVLNVTYEIVSMPDGREPTDYDKEYNVYYAHVNEKPVTIGSAFGMQEEGKLIFVGSASGIVSSSAMKVVYNDDYLDVFLGVGIYNVVLTNGNDEYVYQFEITEETEVTSVTCSDALNPAYRLVAKAVEE